MSERFSRPVVLDATVLSNYASTDSVTWLTTTLNALQTVPAVRNELEQGREIGYAYLEHALDVLESGRIGIAETAPEQLQQDYPTVQTRLDPGEAEALVAAHTADGTLVTRSEWKPTPSGVGVSDNIARQSTRYDSSGCSTAFRPASIIS